MAMGRPQKPYICSWNGADGKPEMVPGLYHCPDGRWRINATGQKYTEADERRAVQKFKAQLPQPATVDSPSQIEEGSTSGDGRLILRSVTPSKEFWDWLREQLIERPAWVAEQVGIPELASLARFNIPQDSIRLDAIMANYENHGTAGDTSKARAVKVFKELMKQTQAQTLDDLSTEKLKAFKAWIEQNPDRSSGSYRTWYFGCVKSIIGFGMKTGMDAAQITSTLARCKVLWSSTQATAANPTPISREDLHTILAKASPLWRAMILVGLNCALHLEEVCALRWSDFDMKAGTYATIRNKTKADRIPRAAVLWKETIDALNNLQRKAPVYVFTSMHGTRYNRAARGNKFALLRDKCKVNSEVTFDWIKDGAYTAAINDTNVEERFARVLAGHRSPGLQDSYVLRNPRCTAGACDAVYKAYGPFPEQPELTKRQKAGMKIA